MYELCLKFILFEQHSYCIFPEEKKTNIWILKGKKLEKKNKKKSEKKTIIVILVSL